MSLPQSQLTPLTLNRAFTQEFIDADPPCFAMGLVEERGQPCGLLALRPAEAIPSEVSDLGLNFGHALYGSATFEVLHFVFGFYGFQTYNVLVNPNNPLVQAVLTQMLEGGDYFFFALTPDNHVTTFRVEIGDDILTELTANLARIRNSTTTEGQYQRAVASFSKHPHPEGILLNWVCRSNLEYLDLTTDRVVLNPA